MSNSLFSNKSDSTKLIIRAADGRFIRRARTRVQWLYASSDPLPAQPDAIFEAFHASDGRIFLRFADPNWNRAVECIGGDNALWADGPAIPSDQSERDKLPKECRFVLESTGELGEHAFRIRAMNGKLCAPKKSSEVDGHLEANASDGDPNTVFYLSPLY